MKKVIHITLTDDGAGGVRVQTNDEAPTIGRVLTPAETLSIDLLRTCKLRANEVSFTQELPAIRLARRALNPEDLGYTFGPHARDDAREVLGIARTETKPAR